MASTETEEESASDIKIPANEVINQHFGCYFKTASEDKIHSHSGSHFTAPSVNVTHSHSGSHFKTSSIDVTQSNSVSHSRIPREHVTPAHFGCHCPGDGPLAECQHKNRIELETTSQLRTAPRSENFPQSKTTLGQSEMTLEHDTAAASKSNNTSQPNTASSRPTMSAAFDGGAKRSVIMVGKDEEDGGRAVQYVTHSIIDHVCPISSSSSVFASFPSSTSSIASSFITTENSASSSSSSFFSSTHPTTIISTEQVTTLHTTSTAAPSTHPSTASQITRRHRGRPDSFGRFAPSSRHDSTASDGSMESSGGGSCGGSAVGLLGGRSNSNCGGSVVELLRVSRDATQPTTGSLTNIHGRLSTSYSAEESEALDEFPLSAHHHLPPSRPRAFTCPVTRTFNRKLRAKIMNRPPTPTARDLKDIESAFKFTNLSVVETTLAESDTEERDDNENCEDATCVSDNEGCESLKYNDAACVNDNKGCAALEYKDTTCVSDNKGIEDFVHKDAPSASDNEVSVSLKYNDVAEGQEKCKYNIKSLSDEYDREVDAECERVNCVSDKNDKIDQSIEKNVHLKDGQHHRKDVSIISNQVDKVKMTLAFK